ncbi:hypothetical protein G443_003335 [Actinoalloteichus cyanogriseus DSM 43889]|uniref:Basic proline-rich protein n=1 Tax=Actinoalloteichus caeruleus DSM 43889 TaxID=1120930 RepID=A0ABT1JKM5_ACTCY|nr:hypothetical protein [Actinoalloteichus caeruleus DSM 43889]
MGIRRAGAHGGLGPPLRAPKTRAPSRRRPRRSAPGLEPGGRAVPSVSRTAHRGRTGGHHLADHRGGTGSPGPSAGPTDPVPGAGMVVPPVAARRRHRVRHRPREPGVGSGGSPRDVSRRAARTRGAPDRSARSTSRTCGSAPVPRPRDPTRTGAGRGVATAPPAPPRSASAGPEGRGVRRGSEARPPGGRARRSHQVVRPRASPTSAVGEGAGGWPPPVRLAPVARHTVLLYREPPGQGRAAAGTGDGWWRTRVFPRRAVRAGAIREGCVGWPSGDTHRQRGVDPARRPRDPGQPLTFRPPPARGAARAARGPPGAGSPVWTERRRGTEAAWALATGSPAGHTHHSTAPPAGGRRSWRPPPSGAAPIVRHPRDRGV